MPTATHQTVGDEATSILNALSESLRQPSLLPTSCHASPLSSEEMTKEEIRQRRINAVGRREKNRNHHLVENPNKENVMLSSHRASSGEDQRNTVNVHDVVDETATASATNFSRDGSRENTESVRSEPIVQSQPLEVTGCCNDSIPLASKSPLRVNNAPCVQSGKKKNAVINTRASYEKVKDILCYLDDVDCMAIEASKGVTRDAVSKVICQSSISSLFIGSVLHFGRYTPIIPFLNLCCVYNSLESCWIAAVTLHYILILGSTLTTPFRANSTLSMKQPSPGNVSVASSVGADALLTPSPTRFKKHAKSGKRVNGTNDGPGDNVSVINTPNPERNHHEEARSSSSTQRDVKHYDWELESEAERSSHHRPASAYVTPRPATRGISSSPSLSSATSIPTSRRKRNRMTAV